MSKERIELTDSVMDAIMKLSEGNPGAMTVCIELLEKGGKIDPDSALGGFGELLSLDTLGIYGSHIWMLFKDVCKENLIHTVGILRGHQLGYLKDSEIHHAIQHAGEGIKPDEIVERIQKRLPKFGRIE